MNLKENIVKISEDAIAIIDPLIKNFLSELELYYNNTKDKELFQYNERAFLGFLNNAIIRQNYSTEEIITIQEYCIKNKNTNKSGRPDLLYFDPKNNKCVLFEAKHNHTKEIKDDQYNETNTNDYLDDIISQAENYYNYPDENKFYSDKNVFLCGIVFDSVKLSSSIREYLEKHDIELNNYFSYTIYDENITTDLLNIYGKIKMMN